MIGSAGDLHLSRVFLAHTSLDDHPASDVYKQNTFRNKPEVTHIYPGWDLGSPWEYIRVKEGNRYFFTIFSNVDAYF